MIFQSGDVEKLYRRYRHSGNAELLEQIHSSSRSLIEVIAKSVDPEQFDDLVQEGHVKLHMLVQDGNYIPSRGPMYTFLDRALRNHMYDYLRKQRGESVEYLLDAIGTEPVLATDEFDVTELLEYESRRFSSLDDGLVREAIGYIVSNDNSGYKGAVRTLVMTYSISRQLATTMFRSTQAVLRMDCMGYDWQANKADALEVVGLCGTEITMLPEVVLLFGKEAALLQSMVFGGAYVKF